MNINVFFMPHPPIILDAIGGDEREKARCTIEGMIMLGKKVSKIKPETIVFITPHGNSFSNGTCILGDEVLKGDFAQFGHSEINFEKKVNTKLSNMIYDCFEARNFVCVMMDKKLAESYNIKANLDHGVMVPMYFIDQFYTNYNIVHITPGNTPLEENYFLGKLVKDMVDEYTNENPTKILIVASGDLSHVLLDSGPYAYNENGHMFDKTVKKSIIDKEPLTLLQLNHKFIEEAAQCGLRSYIMGFGYFDGLKYESKVISYEGPFGVGYLTGFLECANGIVSHSLTNNRGELKGNTNLSHIDTIQGIINNRYNQRIVKEDDYIKLARKSIEHYVHQHTKFDVKKAEHHDKIFSKGFLDDAMNKRAGAFVSIHKEDKLRGCIGTTEPTSPNLVDEIIYNAISACSSDPRFHPVEVDELKDLEISVDILSPYESIDSMNELNINKYGVIVEQGFKRGLLLPNLDGINSVDEQVSIAKQKAGIVNGKIKLYRFEVVRHEID